MTDITELAQSLKAAAESVIKHYGSEWFEAGHQVCTVHKSKINLISLTKPANVLALVEELEKAQQERENWRTSFDNERFRADKLKAHIDDIEPIRAAAEKLIRCKGRYHSEQNYRALAALFGVTAPDLPPLDGESRTVTPVTYSENADADHFRKWAWEQVKGEVSTEEWTTGDNITYFGFFCWGWDMRRQYNEQRPVTVNLPDCDFAVVQHMSGGSVDYCNGFVDGTQNAIRAMRDAGVDVREAE